MTIYGINHGINTDIVTESNLAYNCSLRNCFKMGDDGWVTIKPDNDDIEKEVEKFNNDIANKLSVSNIKPASDDAGSLASSDSQNDTEPTRNDYDAGSAATGNGDVENGNDITRRSITRSDSANSEKEHGKRRKSAPLKFLKKMGSKDSPDRDKIPSKSKARRTSQIPMELKVESLPQFFITKYLGSDACTGLWGIQHTHGPVTKLVDNVGKMKKDEDLPLVQLKVSNKGKHLRINIKTIHIVN